eukprot:2283458-Prorocentrum_lima.AAC.1
MTTWKRLDEFWLRGASTNSFKILVWNAVIRSKLLYGLESLQLNRSHRDMLDVFHLKGLRKILRLTTTYVNRSNTNSKVYSLATEACRQPVVPISHIYE